MLEARCILILSGLLLVFISSVLWYAKAHPLPTDQWRATLESGLSRAVFLVLTLAAAVGIARAARVKSQIILGFSLLLLLWLDVLTHAPRLNPTVERWVYEPSLATAELKFSPAPSPGGSRAMVSPFADDRLNHLALTNAVDDYLYSRMSLFANANLLEQIPKIDGFFSLSLREENRVRSLLYASTNASVPNLAKFLGVSYLTAPGKMIDWTAQPGSLPFATAGQTPIFADGPTTVRALAEAAFDPSRFVYLPVEARSQTIGTNAASAKVAITRFTAHRIEFTVDAEEPAWFVAAQAFYHPWRAYVDGQERRIWPANHAFQALAVPAGRHLVELVYRDRWFRSGVALSGLTLLACAGLWLRSKP